MAAYANLNRETESMKEPYTPARVEVIELEAEDIITASGNGYAKKKKGFVEYVDLDEDCPMDTN